MSLFLVKFDELFLNPAHEVVTERPKEFNKIYLVDTNCPNAMYSYVYRADHTL